MIIFNQIADSIYPQPIWLTVLIIITIPFIWRIIGKYIQVRYNEIIWFIINVILFLISIFIVIFITLISRIQIVQSYSIILNPLTIFFLAQNKPEYYREMLMNVFLFVPLGITLSNFISRKIRKPRRIIITIVFSMLLSCLIEWVQYQYLLGTAETADIICNTLGSFIGSTSILMADALERFKRKME
jgi:VanZ like family.